MNLFKSSRLKEDGCRLHASGPLLGRKLGGPKNWFEHCAEDKNQMPSARNQTSIAKLFSPQAKLLWTIIHIKHQQQYLLFVQDMFSVSLSYYRVIKTLMKASSYYSNHVLTVKRTWSTLHVDMCHL